MRVFVAGASGAIGRVLVPKLIAAGHEVTGITRKQAGAEALRAAGARAAICDALDPAAVDEAVSAARPELIVSELTSLQKDYELRTIDYEPTSRLRVEGGHNLVAVGRKAGTRRYISQSIAFVYEPQGDWIKHEQAPTYRDAPGRFKSGVEATLTSEREALGAEGMEGLVLRYGQLYGPGTDFDHEGSIAKQVRTRRFPVVGKGSGVFSFIHLDDAADATVARGRPRSCRDLQRRRRRPGTDARVASHLRAGDRRQAADACSEAPCPVRRRQGGGRDEHRAAGGPPTQGEARAWLGAGAPELAPGFAEALA